MRKEVFIQEDHRIKDILDYRLDVNVLHSDDLVCAWGDFQSEHYNNKIKDK